MILLCDTNVEMVGAWWECFGDEVPAIQTDVFKCRASVLVAPGNSVGLMSGGLDLEIAKRFPGVETLVQQGIKDRGGNLPVGKSLLVPTHTKDGVFSYVLYVPTMVLAQDVSKTDNAYLAMQAILRDTPVELSTVIPGLCAGVGRMSVKDVARQMYHAYAGSGGWE